MFWLKLVDKTSGMNNGRRTTIIAGTVLFVALASLVFFMSSGSNEVSLADPVAGNNTDLDAPGLPEIGVGAGGGSATTLESNGTSLADGSTVQESSSPENSSPAETENSDRTDANGFPTTERELAAFLRAADSSLQRLGYHGPQGGADSQGEPTSEPTRFIDLTSAESLSKALRPSSSFNINDIVSGSGPEAASPALHNRGQNGVFHVACNVSHFAYDDPIAIPGQPGRAHLHMFFGNTETNAYSDADSILNRGNGSCQHEELNRTGYWVPALLDGQDHALVPDYIQVYYESTADHTNLVSFPQGMNFIAGNAFATQPQEGINHRGQNFRCGWYGSNRFEGPGKVDVIELSDTIPDCDPDFYSHMMVDLAAPHCWNGELDWSAQSPNVVYPAERYGPCPASHSTLVPQLFYRMTFDLSESPTRTSTWYLSSDIDRETGERRGPAGSSLHADWINGWNQPLLDSIFDNCINRVNRWCGPIHLGDGQLTDHVVKRIGALDQRISPEALLSTCPVRDSYDGNPRNVAYCLN